MVKDIVASVTQQLTMVVLPDLAARMKLDILASMKAASPAEGTGSTVNRPSVIPHSSTGYPVNYQDASSLGSAAGTANPVTMGTTIPSFTLGMLPLH
jgi:nitrate reductase cytochrome c-type subunit